MAEALRTLAPDGVRVGVRRITADDVGALWEVEAAHVRQAVPRRQHEFATGRVLLRELIGRPVAIPPAANRSPTLPTGLRGSLAHDRELVVAAVSAEPSVLAIGIDLEPTTRLEPEIAALVLRADEEGVDAHHAFTLKEAAYKAWSTMGGRLLDHHDVRVSVSGGAFRAEVVPDGAVFEGRSTKAAGHWLALVVVKT